MILYKLYGFLPLLTVTVQATARVKCGNELEKPSNDLLRTYKEIAYIQGSLDETANEIAIRPVQTIRTFFHIIGKTIEEAKTVTSEVIVNQTQVMNTAYQQSGFQFSLADITYDNNTAWASGSRTSSDTSGEMAMKTKWRNGTYAELNIYILSNLIDQGLYGECTFPVYLKSTAVKNSTETLIRDGCTIDFKTLPWNASLPEVNEGKTAVHEIGHWLGLIHVWGDIQGCVGTDDVDDTPLQFRATQMKPTDPCPPPDTDTCPSPGVDSTSNYMDYTNDYCLNTFSPGQIVRMNRLWSLRN